VRARPCLLALSLWVACGDEAAPAPDDRGDASSERDAAVAPRDARVDAARAPLDAAQPASTDAGDATSVSEDAALPDASSSHRPGWRIVFQDEFDGAKGSLPDKQRWVMETGGHGFGNNELEYYTARPENASLDGEGKLVITARAEKYMNREHTSARLTTQGKFAHTYGRYEARLQLPTGQGIWPAFWMLGANLGATRWPDCGELDIMENIGREPTTVHGTLHGPGYAGGDSIGKSYQLPDKAAFSADFHVYAVEWEENVVRWYVDDVLYQTRKPSDLGGKRWVYDHDFFLLLNLAVGGQWPGNPDATTKFPQRLVADYVRVYARE
jgi:beta-glucanase (GH16 family)